MRSLLSVALLLLGAARVWAAPALTEARFREQMGFAPTARMTYRDLACRSVSFAGFAQEMERSGVHADTDRAADGIDITLTARLRGRVACPAPYPAITELPPFDLRDLAGKRVTAANLRGKPTLVNFYFARCVPCIREVGPLNKFAAARPHMNFLAVTFDAPDEARAFVTRHNFHWRVVPDARELIDRVRVKQYPMMALFDAQGRLLGMRGGGAKDELEAANVAPQLARWIDGLLRE